MDENLNKFQKSFDDINNIIDNMATKFKPEDEKNNKKQDL